MKQWMRKYALLLLVLLVITGVCLLFSCRKSGMFIDEIYTYGLSNSHFAPFLQDVAGGDLHDRLLTRQQLFEYVAVDHGEILDFASVYDNQVRDVHPPLYYWLFNVVSSLTPDVFSKWTGLALDYGIYLWALLALWRLVMALYDSPANAAATVALYGLSSIGLSTMLMIRMYVLMTALTVELAVLIVRLMRRPKAICYPLVGLVIFLGLMTQYYFVFYAFFLCGFFVLRQLVRRQYRSMGAFAACAFGGVALLVLCFPACLDQLFAEKLVSGANALENLSLVSQYAGRLGIMLARLRHGLHAPLYLLPVLLLLLLLCGGGIASAKKQGLLRFDGLIVLLPAVITLPLVAVISPVTEERYLYNLIPILLTLWSLLLHLIEQGLRRLPRKECWKNAAAVAILALSLWEARTVPPDYLYPEYRDYDAALAPYAESPCVYMTDGYFAPLTQDLLQLMTFEDFFVTGEPDSEALDAYLDQRKGETCVVYIDRSAFWSSGFVPEEMLPRLLGSTDYTGWEPLYENGLSAAYLLT